MLTIPHDQLSPDALEALVDDFVTRDGAVQGHADPTLEQRREQVMAQLRRGTAVIVFDEEDQSISITPATQPPVPRP